MKLLAIIFGLLMIGCNSTETESTDNKFGKVTQQKIEHKIIEKELQNGDLIFHTSRSNQSQAIQIATNSKYSHMGIIYQEGNDFFVYEAIQPVKMTNLKDWINRGVNGNYVVKRLKNSNEILTDEGIEKMKLVGKKYLGKDYDLLFEWSDDKIYCSELAWKIYKEAFNIEIGTLEKIKDFDLSNKTVQQKVKERYGNNIPTDELVITPDRMFNAKNLITIKEK